LTLSKDLQTAIQTEIPRRYFPSSSTWLSSTSLHVFVDASVKAYGAAAYITYGSETSLVMAKSRVAPLKKLTLPQLELMAAVLGARLSSYLQTHLQASDVYLWSDSQIVLHWLSSKKELKRFVHNRVTEIQSIRLRRVAYKMAGCRSEWNLKAWNFFNHFAVDFVFILTWNLVDDP
jgi:ribonuclease HI